MGSRSGAVSGVVERRLRRLRWLRWSRWSRWLRWLRWLRRSSKAGIAVAFVDLFARRGGMWDAIVVTATQPEVAEAALAEVRACQQMGVVAERTLLLSAVDPKSSVGSGGATLNALYMLAEHLSARSHLGFVNADMLYRRRCLVLHSGRAHLLSPLGSFNVRLPLVLRTAPQCSLTQLQLCLSLLQRWVDAEGPAGVWVCSLDVFVVLSQPLLPAEDADATVWALPCDDLHYASGHGVYRIAPDSFVADVGYRLPEQQLRELCNNGSGSLPMVAGLVFFKPDLAVKLLQLVAKSPLDCCTYLAADNNVSPILLSLFFDIMLPMCARFGFITQERFVSGERSGFKGSSSVTSSIDQRCRWLLWQSLSNYTMKAVRLERATKFCYIDAPVPEHLLRLLGCEMEAVEQLSESSGIDARSDAGSVRPAQVSRSAVVLNSCLSADVHVADRCVIINCQLLQPLKVASGAVLAGLDCPLGVDNIPADIVVASVRCANGFRVPVVFQRYSRLVPRLNVDPFDTPVLPLCPNDALFSAFVRSSIGDAQQPSDMYGAALGDLTKVTLTDLLANSDYRSERSWLEILQLRIAISSVEQVLSENSSNSCMTLYEWAVRGNVATEMLSALDAVATRCAHDYGTVARVLANIADLLGCMAGGRGGLRSGPAGNEQWRLAFDLLNADAVAAGIAALAAQRQRWLLLNDDSMLVRAARHYEGAAQILIRKACALSNQFIHLARPSALALPALSALSALPSGLRHSPAAATPSDIHFDDVRFDDFLRGTACISCQCCARVDLAGGWSDTPPICYEHGGRVLNVALTIDGKATIGCRIRKLVGQSVIEAFEGPNLAAIDAFKNNSASSALDAAVTKWSITTRQCVLEYNKPQTKGALLKACLVFCEVISTDADKLNDECISGDLASAFGSGLEVDAWADLPQGSGLGTSSILAGCLVAGLWTCRGWGFALSDVLHAVLCVEQLMTTGGGWQDQVGGLLPSFTVGLSANQLPVKVHVRSPPLADVFLHAFQQQAFLVYTGKTRLAKNLLQTVLRNWYARDQTVVGIIDHLVALAADSEQAVVDGRLDLLGANLDKYQTLKNQIAPGTLTEFIQKLRNAIAPVVYGSVLAGAGGGGFLFVLTKPGVSFEQLHQLVGSVSSEVTVHRVAVDMDGLRIFSTDVQIC